MNTSEKERPRVELGKLKKLIMRKLVNFCLALRPKVYNDKLYVI